MKLCFKVGYEWGSNVVINTVNNSSEASVLRQKIKASLGDRK
jgi:hypothetical protein